MAASANVINVKLSELERTSGFECVELVPDDIRRLRAVAAEIFAGVEAAKIASDPELPDCSYLVVRVKAAGTVEEILKQEREWHRRTQDLFVGAPERLNQVQLSIDAQE